ncbi:hypothetical protein V8F06_003671 [Rhypophila decipiens]
MGNGRYKSIHPNIPMRNSVELNRTSARIFIDYRIANLFCLLCVEAVSLCLEAMMLGTLLFTPCFYKETPLPPPLYFNNLSLVFFFARRDERTNPILRGESWG